MGYAKLPSDATKNKLRVPFYIQNAMQPQLPLANPMLGLAIQKEFYEANLTSGKKWLWGGWPLETYLAYANNMTGTASGFGDKMWTMNGNIYAQTSPAFDNILPKDTVLISETGAVQLLYRPLFLTPQSRDTNGSSDVRRYTLRLPSGLPVDVVETYKNEAFCSKRTITYRVLLDFAEATNINCDKTYNGNGMFLIEDCAGLDQTTC
jgi:hypothetical protein